MIIIRRVRLVLLAGLSVVLTVGGLPVLGQESAQTVPDSLIGLTWQWEHFADGVGEMDVPTANYTITFADDGSFRARADCNRVAGTYTADAGTITIQPGPSTLMACPEGSLGGEFVDYLSQVAVYSFTEDGKLLLELPVDSGTLTFSAQPRITGSVAYLARMALPDDAVVRVQLQDVSIADAPAAIVGEQVFVTDGAQVPFAFAIAYPASAIQTSGRYSVSARITDSAGNLLFVSDSLVPVITNDVFTADLVLVPIGVPQTPAEATDMATFGSVTGTVTYLPRMALPDGAVLLVELADVSRADAPAFVLASQQLMTNGRQVPLSFALTYDAATIQGPGRYSVSARIFVDGSLRWTTDTITSVINNGVFEVELILVQVGS